MVSIHLDCPFTDCYVDGFLEGAHLVMVSGLIPRKIPWTEWSSILPPSAYYCNATSLE